MELVPKSNKASKRTGKPLERKTSNQDSAQKYKFNCIEDFIKHHPNFSHQGALQSICVSLRKLGINYFSHAHIDNQNTMATLGLKPEFFKVYFEKGYQQFDLHKAKLPIGESYILWDHIGINATTAAMHSDFMSFNLGHTFSIYRKTSTDVHCYHFGGELGNHAINSQYFMRLDELKRFIHFFTDKVKHHKELQMAYQMRVPLVVGQGGYMSSMVLHQKTLPLKLNRIYIDENAHLTSREVECLEWAARGKTVDETAFVLQISPRTVKAHLNNCKEKFNCRTLYQLGLKYAQYRNLTLS